MGKRATRRAWHVPGLDVAFVLAVGICLLLVSANVAFATGDAATTEPATTEPSVLFSQSDPVTTYDVWVGGVQVTSENMGDVLSGTGNTGLVTYDSDTHTLTLGDGTTAVSIAGVANSHHGAGIESMGDITIDVESTTTLTGASCDTGSVAGIYVQGDLTHFGEGGLTVTAGDGRDVSDAGNFSAGIYVSGDYHLGIDGTRKFMNKAEATGGSGAPWSAGVWVDGSVIYYFEGILTAHGADNPGGTSVGVRAKGVRLYDYTAEIHAYGGAGTISAGIYLSATDAAGSTVVSVESFTDLVAQGGSATRESYGIRCANATDLVSLPARAGSVINVTASAGTASDAKGTSVGVFGTVDFQAPEGGMPKLVATSAEATTSMALSSNPKTTGDFGWRTSAVPTWQPSATSPFQYSATERSVTLRYLALNVYVGGTEVTIANMDDVLGDGTVSFAPSYDGPTLGTLSLNGSHLKRHIYAYGSIVIDLTGENTVDEVNDFEVYGLFTYGSDEDPLLYGNGSIAITGTGSLTISASVDEFGGKGTSGIKAGEDGESDLTVSGSAKVSATARDSSMSAYGIQAGAITVSDSAVLEGVGKRPEDPESKANMTYGIKCKSLSLSGKSGVEGEGSDAQRICCGIIADEVNVADEATLTAVSGNVLRNTPISSSVGLFISGSSSSFDVTGGTLDLRSGSSTTSLACNVAPNLTYAPYQWKTADADPWTYSTGTAYSYDAAQTYIRIAPVDYDVCVGGVEVNSLDKDDVLGDGTVSFTPSSDGKSLGTLSLRSAHVEGGIRAWGALTVDLAGDNVVDMTGDYYDTEIVGIQTEHSYSGSWKGGYAITVTGSGSLVVNASAEDYADKVIAIRAGDDGNDDLTISDSAHVSATAANGDGAAYGVLARDIVLSGSSELDGLTSGIGQSSEEPAQTWGIFCNNLSLAGSSKVVGRGCDAFFECYGIVADESARVADDATLEATSRSAPGRSNDGISMGLSGATWDSTPTFVVTGGTVNLESGSASISAASYIAPDLSGYASYRWKIAEGNALTSSTATAYAYDKSQTYIQIVPPAKEPVTPAPAVTPTPAPVSAPSTSAASVLAELPETGDDMTASLATSALVVALAVANVLVAVWMRRTTR